MRKGSWAVLGLVGVSALALSGCASPLPVGILYTGVSLPVAAGEKASAVKTGTAECRSYLGLIARGDCSVGAAMRNGGVRNVGYVDYKADNILGVFGTYTTTVYGD